MKLEQGMGYVLLRIRSEKIENVISSIGYSSKV